MQHDEKAAFDVAFDAVEEGESFVLNLRGRPLAVLIPYDLYRDMKDALAEGAEQITTNKGAEASETSK